MAQMKLRLILWLAAILLLTSCSGAAFWLANSRIDFADSRIYRDVAYGAEQQQKLDIYLPPSGRPTRDIIVFFYGGRWESGRKEDYAFVADTFLRRGYGVVIPDYRKYPDVKFPAFADDAALAVRFTSAHMSDYGVKAPPRLFLLGHSAGAHLGALIVSDRHYLEGRGNVRAFAGLAGPYSFVPEEKDLQDMFGPPERYRLMQAPTFIDGDEPPMLLLHGEDDTTVLRANADHLAATIRRKGGDVETQFYSGIDHIDIIAALSWLKSGDAPVAADVDAFFRRNGAE